MSQAPTPETSTATERKNAGDEFFRLLAGSLRVVLFRIGRHPLALRLNDFDSHSLPSKNCHLPSNPVHTR
jgi:hypothetical protein